MLPFDNLGGDEATGRLADGITEDMITDLARFRDLDVIARNSTEVYKGKPVDIRQVGKDLGVGYVLEGSIQRPGDRVRVTAQLVDAAAAPTSGANRWDRPAGDVFAAQDEMADQVASRIGGSSSVREIGSARRRSGSGRKTSRPTTLPARHRAQASDGPHDVEEAKGLFEQALAKDPSSPGPMSAAPGPI